ncbi:MAG TPA: hypothetical protein VJI68_03275 [Candidatus Nanoarchaeia archaeon]|nr:hypothetical protein [Candidatus Nanoarchaeia archaeon]
MSNSDIADLLIEMFNGKQEASQIGNWSISNYNSPMSLELLYKTGKAVYGFWVSRTRLNNIKLDNIHREAKIGEGTPSLKELEEILILTARKINSKIVVVFPKFDQEDTARWLEKNNYNSEIEEGETYYYKEIS